MAQPALTSLGEYAFEAYLLHWPLNYVVLLVHAANGGVAPETRGYEWLALTWLVSALFSHYVEAPATGWFRRVTEPLLAARKMRLP